MASLESIFIKEFKRSTRLGGLSKNIFEIPLPDEAKNWKVSGGEVFAIKGIDGENAGLFAGLNKTLVKKLPKNVSAERRKVDLVTRDFVRDCNNRYIYEEVKIPTDSIVVISSVNLNLTYKYSCNEPGFGYIDFVTNGKEREYLYYIPKKYVYKTNQTALALSVKNMKNFTGMGYQTWNNGVIYLHVIPYSPNKNYVGSKILKTSHGLNYSSEVKSIVSFWESIGLIPQIGLSNTTEYGNLVLKETQRGYEEYTSVDEFSLGDKVVFGEDYEGLEGEGSYE